MITQTIRTEPDFNQSPLASADRWLSKLEDLLNKLAAFTIFIVMLATVLQIFSRLFGFPVPGFLELSEQAIAIFAFLGAAYGQRLGAHIRMELLVGAIDGRGRWIMELITTSLALAVIGILTYYSFWFFIDAYVIGDSTLDYGLPTWPSKLLVPIAFSIWFLRLCLELIGFGRLSINPALEPVAVPAIKSASDVAQDEVTETFGRHSKDHDKTDG